MLASRRRNGLWGLATCAAFAACATGTGSATATALGGAGGGAATGTAVGGGTTTATGVGGAAGGAAGSGGGGAAAGAGGQTTGGTGGTGGSGTGAGGGGGGTVVTTCTDWSFGALGNAGDATGDVDVRYLEYRFVVDVLEVRVDHAPFDPTVVTNEPGLQLWDDGGLNIIDLYLSGGVAHFATSTDGGTSFSPLASNPDLAIDASSATTSGVVVYRIPVDLLTTHLTGAAVPTELFVGAYAFLPASGFTDGVFPYPSTATNLNFTTRDQCWWPLASNVDPQGDTADLVDYGALSYNAESGHIRVRIDLYYETTFGQQELQAYLWDQSVAGGNAAFLFDAYDGLLYLGVRNSSGVWNYDNAPGSCTTFPGVLSSATRLLTIDCPQSDVGTVIAQNGGQFVFNGAHAYRMGGLTWSELAVEDDEFPDGWIAGSGFSAFDPIVIP